MVWLSSANDHDDDSIINRFDTYDGDDIIDIIFNCSGVTFCNNTVSAATTVTTATTPMMLLRQQLQKADSLLQEDEDEDEVEDAARNITSSSKEVDVLDSVFEHVESYTCKDNANKMIQQRQQQREQRRRTNGDILDFVFEHVETYTCNSNNNNNNNSTTYDATTDPSSLTTQHHYQLSVLDTKKNNEIEIKMTPEEKQHGQDHRRRNKPQKLGRKRSMDIIRNWGRKMKQE